jgi:hypothetical protein
MHHRIRDEAPARLRLCVIHSFRRLGEVRRYAPRLMLAPRAWWRRGR